MDNNNLKTPAGEETLSTGFIVCHQFCNFSDYFNPRTGDIKNGAKLSDLEFACEDYCAAILKELQEMFSPVSVSGCRGLVEVNHDYAPETWYGSRAILSDLEKAEKHGFGASCIGPYVQKLKALYKKLLFDVNPYDEGAVRDLIGKANRLIDAIEKYYNTICRAYPHECRDCECKELIKKIIESRIIINHTLGEFRCHNGPKITIFTKSIAKVTCSEEEFNTRFWQTLAHETFHYYHYLLCVSPGKGHEHWFNDGQSPFEDGEPDDWRRYMPRQGEGKENYRINDNSGFFRISGSPNASKIVKESLASYFEHYCGIYGCNKGLAKVKTIADALKESWSKHSVKIWPYSGAEAFLRFDRGTIDHPDSLFREVLMGSIFDWDEACKIILDSIK